MYLHRGTTPTLDFVIPYDASEIDLVYITFYQNGRVVFEMEKEDLEVEDKNLRCTLTQDQTLTLSPEYQLDIQIRALLVGNAAVASQIMSLSVNDILKDGPI